jgi:glycosyltransferase involved in cell wall biosynthesis
MLSHRNRTLIQVSGSLESKLGGPHSVVMSTNDILAANFDHKLIVFGSCSIQDTQIKVLPTLRNNRYGLPSLKIKRSGLKEFRHADILLIHGFYLFSTLIALFYFPTRNVYLMPHGSLEAYQNKKGRVRKYLFRKVVEGLLRGRKIHFLVGSDSETISILQIYPGVNVTVVGLGIDTTSASVGKSTGPKEPVKLFCLSRISEKKRIDLCIQALSKLNSSKQRYTLEIIGSGDLTLENELRNLVSDLNLDGDVTFSGFLEGVQKTDAILRSDIFLLPSENENFAVAVAESISLGKPVVVSKFVAMHEFVDRHRTGITLNSLKVDTLVEAIENVHSNYAAFQEKCLESAHLLDWKEVQKKWLQVLKS